MLNDTIILAIIGTSATLVGLLLKYAGLSACTNIDLCCGLINVQRQPNLEKNLHNNTRIVEDIETKQDETIPVSLAK